jgi:hypothetical protein
MSKRPQMELDFFTGTGEFSLGASEKLMVKIIEELLTRNSVDDLMDGELISATLMRDYHIAVSADYTRAFFGKWVETVRSRTKR